MVRIVEPRRNIWRTHPAERAGLLVDADDYYRSFYREALQAERHILLSGWQFDSNVALLRGPEAEQAPAPVTLLAFLNHLCETKPELQIWILAWDFHIVFAIEREWMQKLVFDWATNERLHFRFDSHHVENGSHHQKFAVIDQRVSFLGGLDLCEHRWDERSHKNVNPLRISRGEPHRPFHDIQVYLRGPEIAGSISELFLSRWERSGGEPIALQPARAAGDRRAPAADGDPQGLLPIESSVVALGRTDPYGAPDGPEKCIEIRNLYLDAISAAEELVYIETQYFSSHVIGEALERRMRDSGKPALEIVLVINMKGETLKEQAAVGLAQAELIGKMREVAAATGHRLGIYYTIPACGPGETVEHTTYVHSKLMIVDDRLLTVGSANLTNRSLVVDTELNATVEAARAGDPLGQSIRKIRAALLGEHTGGPDVDRGPGLVAALDEIAARGDAPLCRLRRHPSPTSDEQAILSVLDPQRLPFDPDSIEEQDSNLLQSLKNLFQNLGPTSGVKGI
jgi:phospholipase D1/2